MSSAVQRCGSKFACELMNYSRFRTVFANAVRNLRSLETYCNMSLWTWEMFDRGRFGVGTAIDAPPPFVLSFQLFEGETSFESPAVHLAPR